MGTSKGNVSKRMEELSIELNVIIDKINEISNECKIEDSQEKKNEQYKLLRKFWELKTEENQLKETSSQKLDKRMNLAISQNLYDDIRKIAVMLSGRSVNSTAILALQQFADQCRGLVEAYDRTFEE